MSRYQLSPAAASDLDHIDNQTILTFGIRQAMTLTETFEQAFTMLAENPGLGHRRDDLSPPSKAFRYWTVLRRFVVVYEPPRWADPDRTRPGRGTGLGCDPGRRVNGQHRK